METTAQAAAELLLSDIVRSQDRLPREVQRCDGAFVVLNRSGPREPIFWCFNNWVEPLSLAHHIGPDQPLFATRSFNTLLSGRAAKRLILVDYAKLLTKEILRLHGPGPKILGGNCQAAPIAEAVAHGLVQTGRPAPELILMDHELDYCYPGHATHLFGSQSKDFNPFLQGRDPTSIWINQFQSMAYGFLTAEHGQYFRAPAIHQLCAYLRSVVDAADQNRPPRTGLIEMPDPGKITVE
jgi:hypothetical protein